MLSKIFNFYERSRTKVKDEFFTFEKPIIEIENKIAELEKESQEKGY